MNIASRASPLALEQARRIAHVLQQQLGVVCQIIPLSTLGDRLQTGRPGDFGGKGVFTREPEEAVRSGAADLAVHSMKDMPAEDVDDLCIAAIPERASVHDLWIGDVPLEQLPAGAVVGTASLRRQAQVLRQRSDLQVALMRGNVGTRLNKVAAGDYAACIVAAAGVERLGLNVGVPLCTIAHPPAACQGLLAVQMRSDSPLLPQVRAALNAPAAETSGLVERAFLVGLGASCRMAVAAQAHVLPNDDVQFYGKFYAPDGSRMLSADFCVPRAQAVERAQAAGRELLAAADWE